MCHPFVIQSVKDRMMSRRELFKFGAGGAVAAATAAGGISASEAQTNDSGYKTKLGQIVDMTHTLGVDFPTFFGEPGIAFKQKFNIKDDGFNLFDLAMNEHTGTHIDAPLHFSADGKSVDEISPIDLVVPLVVINIKERASANPDAQVTPDDLKEWISKHGPLPKRCCVAMNSGWASLSNDKAKYSGRDEKGKLHFPGFHVESAEMLVEESSASSIAVDTLSLDHGPSSDFATHHAWLPAGRYGIENLANLDAVPEAGSHLIVGAPKIEGGTGGPARIFASYRPKKPKKKQVANACGTK